jgi:transcription elongation factor GreA
VAFGSSVEVEDAKSGKQTGYTLVSPSEAAPAEGKISIDSPVAKALVGARVGATVKLETPRGARELKIVSIG